MLGGVETRTVGLGLPGIISHLCAAPIHRITALIHIYPPPQRFSFVLHKDSVFDGIKKIE